MDFLQMFFYPIGMNFDNVIVQHDIVYRIDNGGALLTRAQGALKKKSSLMNISEWNTFLKENTSNYSKIFKLGGITNQCDIKDDLYKQSSSIKLLGDFKELIKKCNNLTIPIEYENLVVESLEIKRRQLINKVEGCFTNKQLGEKWVNSYINAEYTIQDKLLHYLPVSIEKLFPPLKKVYTIYRGYSFATKSKLKEWANNELVSYTTEQCIIHTKWITSWSLNRKIGFGFSKGKYNILLKTIVSNQKIFIDISSKNSNELEVLVLPGTYKCKILSQNLTSANVELNIDK